MRQLPPLETDTEVDRQKAYEAMDKFGPIETVKDKIRKQDIEMMNKSDEQRRQESEAARDLADEFASSPRIEDEQQKEIKLNAIKRLRQGR
jgi:hypothetical protein